MSDERDAFELPAAPAAPAWRDDPYARHRADVDPPLPQPAPCVLLVDDHDLVRHGLRLLVDTARAPVDWIEATNLADAIAAYAQRPGIALVLLDLNMADCKGLQGLRQFMQAHPAARVVVMSGTHDQFVIGQALAIGAAGFLPKSQPATLTQQAVVELLAAPARGAPRARWPATPGYDRVAELGPRHLEILELVLSGCSNQEIASAAQLALGTVKNYVSAILLALDVRSRSHLISLFH